MKINKLLSKKTDLSLVSYVMAGDPDLNSTYNIIESLIRSGTDIIELGMPFSDPVADGKTIQNAAIRALKNNISLNDIFSLTRKIGKKHPNTPIILMGYLNPINHYGIDKFLESAKSHNISGLIIVDLPYEELLNYPALLNEEEVPLIHLITNLTKNQRLKEIAESAKSFLYYISVFGTTGTKTPDLIEVNKKISELKKQTGKKIAVGFGIKSKSQFKQLQSNADLCVIGSAYCNIIEDNLKNPDILLEKLSNFNNELHSV